MTDQEGLEKAANEFYNRLFLAQDDTSPDVITVLVHRKVDDTMNERLCAPITDFEVEHALVMMHPDKVRTTWVLYKSPGSAQVSRVQCFFF